MANITSYALFAARLLLTGVFLLAGGAKLIDPKGSNDALSNFGLPPSLAGPLGISLVIAEITVAVALASATVPEWYGAWGALALLSIFIIGISANLIRGRKPDCHCFGQLHSAPVGWPTLVRNGVLGGCAGWLVSRGPARLGPNLWVRLVTLDTQQQRIAIVIVCVAAFILFLKFGPKVPALPLNDVAEDQFPENNGAGHSQIHPADGQDAPETQADNSVPAVDGPEGIGLPIGTPAPDFNLSDMMGQSHSLRSLLAPGNALLLVFTSPHCMACQALLPKIGPWMREYKDRINIVLISGGTAQENLAKLGEFGSQVLLQKEFQVSAAYDSIVTPTAVLVGADGLIQSGLAQGRHEIQHLVGSLAELREEQSS